MRNGEMEQMSEHCEDGAQ